MLVEGFIFGMIMLLELLGVMFGALLIQRIDLLGYGI